MNSIKLLIKSIVKKIYRSLPWKIIDRIEYYRSFGKLPNIRNPKTFNEKVLYRKRHACLTDSQYALLADKYAVRQYVSDKIGEQYLIPLYAMYPTPEAFAAEVDQYSNFVLKSNHGAGMVKLIDAVNTEEEKQKLIQEVEHWFEYDFSAKHGEMHYAKIKRCVLIEEKIGEGNDPLTDYKIHLFRQSNGEVFYILQIIDERKNGVLSRSFYVNNLNEIYSGHYHLDSNKKETMNTMLELSQELMGDLEYVRMDWYFENGRIYFGEVTLTPASGVGLGYGDELDKLMGSWWDLSLAPR